MDGTALLDTCNSLDVQFENCRMLATRPSILLRMIVAVVVVALVEQCLKDRLKRTALLADCLHHGTD